jgi:hypothetical protein
MLQILSHSYRAYCYNQTSGSLMRKKGISSKTRQSAVWRVGQESFFLAKDRNPARKHVAI